MNYCSCVASCMLMCLVVPCLLQAEEVGNEPALLIRKTPDAYLVKRDYDDINEVDLLANTDVNLFEEFTKLLMLYCRMMMGGLSESLLFFIFIFISPTFNYGVSIVRWPSDNGSI